MDIITYLYPMIGCGSNIRAVVKFDTHVTNIFILRQVRQ